MTRPNSSGPARSTTRPARHVPRTSTAAPSLPRRVVRPSATTVSASAYPPASAVTTPPPPAAACHSAAASDAYRTPRTARPPLADATARASSVLLLLADGRSVAWRVDQTF